MDTEIEEDRATSETMDEFIDSEDSDSDDAASNPDEQNDEAIKELEDRVKANVYDYAPHVQLIKLLRDAGDLEKLREARETMNKIFPLSPELWLEWLADEAKLATSECEREAVIKLFERAIKDYMSVSVWLEYAQFAIGSMGFKDGVENVRRIFERAVTAVGLHVTQGSLVWEAYREFEAAVLSTLQPPLDAELTPDQLEQMRHQKERVLCIFRRQLSVPLFDMEKTYEEMKEWSNGEVGSFIHQLYLKAYAKFQKIKPFEEALMTSDPPHLAEYFAYIEFETEAGDPTRIQCICERAIAENCLVPELWLNYTKYLDSKLKIESITLPAHERSVRNCPWSVALWNRYILAMERHKQPHNRIKELVDRALQAGFTGGEDFRQLWLTYLDYLRRRIKWSEDSPTELEEFRATFQRAINYMMEYFGREGDPTCSILKYWARIEAKYCRNPEKVRDLWNQIIGQGHGSEAQFWLDFADMERCYGDTKQCRRVLLRGLHSASDWPEMVGEALISFEREEGSLETLDMATEKFDLHVQRLKDKRKRVAEKESMKAEQRQHARESQRKHLKSGRSLGELVCPRDHHSQSSMKRKRKQYQTHHGSPPSVVKLDSDGFKIPPPPGHKSQQERRGSVPDDNLTGSSTEVEEPSSKKKKEEEFSEACGHAIEDGPPRGDSAKDDRTVFVSNLSYSLDEDRIRDIFKEVGQLTDLRLVKDNKKRFRGFCYVEFSSLEEAQEALKKDREPVDGRPMFVSQFENRKSSPSLRPKLKFSTGMEKNKLFVKGLPLTTTCQDLEEIFKEHGPLKGVRLVTYRNGHSKGLAYVEFLDEAHAAAALVKTDGMKVGENTISVAISNPPERKKRPVDTATNDALSIPVLGRGSRETGPRGRSCTQVSLLPRSLRQPQDLPERTLNGVQNGGVEDRSEKMMSNEDFRNMLLRK